jgi:DNA invertase Pin-like site-specific DNA recombinase
MILRFLCTRTFSHDLDPYRTFGPRADTATSTRRLMLAVLGGFADVERDLIRIRTAEGGSYAKAQGAHGRPARRNTKAVAVKYSCSARRRRNGRIDCPRPWFIMANAASI